MGKADPPGDLWGFRETTASVGKWDEGRNSKKGLLWGGALGIHWCLYPFGDPHLCLREYTLTAVRKPDCEH